MSIELFEHNKKAYEAAIKMLAETGKAAVIHPTGTGKSFIGLKLCEDNPDKTVCWLSPSEYIFKTQLENLKKTGAGIPENIKFFTYSKLTFMSDEELEEIKPEYCVYDEFHRAGASVWQLSVNRLLEMYPNVPILGLSATNVRYLDNQRDMAEELFDGHICSHMTLGESIVRGILNPPKYVLSIYSYKEELDKYELRVEKCSTRAAHDEAEKYLEMLRRALENADGVDVVFDKNMTDRTGKYIVFCANYEHMQNIISNYIFDWLSKVDKNPKIYTLYSGDLEAEKSFREFKEDSDNSHLRLLFCIDALNEGVHVDDISGVILLRPTVSPIIYKQQIGRALSASKNKTPVIFDIVNNIENLYSIDSLRIEMEEAVRHFRRDGEGDKIVNERFELIDRLGDCIDLFNKLEGVLSASWDIMFEKAKEFYNRFGHLEVPGNYVTPDDNQYKLGAWLSLQRMVYNGKVEGVMTPERVEKLNSINMRWRSKNEIDWEKNIAACRKYVEEHGDLNVRHDYVTEDGIKLGAFICYLRKHKDAELGWGFTDKSRIREIEELGMIWSHSDYLFDQAYEQCKIYYEENGHLNPPLSYIQNGFKLGQYVNKLKSDMRRGAEKNPKKLALIEEFKIDWRSRSDVLWEKGFHELCEYQRKFGNLCPDSKYKADDNSKFSLYAWVKFQRDSYNNGTLSERRIKLLEAIGFSWEKPTRWDENFQVLKEFKEKHGHLNIPQDLVVNGLKPAQFLELEMRLGQGRVKGRTMPLEHRKKLEELGVYLGKYTNPNDIKWMEFYEKLKLYTKKNGTANISKSDTPHKQLRQWLINQNTLYSYGFLKPERIELLTDLGVKLKHSSPSSFAYGVRHITDFYNMHSSETEIKDDYICEDKFELGKFVSNVRADYFNGKLTGSKCKILNAAGLRL